MRVTLSKEETPITAAAIAAKTTPPATTDKRVFFKDGVIAASTARGEDRALTTAAVAMPFTESFAVSNLSKSN